MHVCMIAFAKTTTNVRLVQLLKQLSGKANVAQQVLYFFLQEDDGIRDVAVTGVQTCALPIYRARNGLSGPSGQRAPARAAAQRRAEHAGVLRPAAAAALSAAVPVRGRGAGAALPARDRSEERRVWKESRSRGAPYH